LTCVNRVTIESIHRLEIARTLLIFRLRMLMATSLISTHVQKNWLVCSLWSLQF